MLKVYYLILLLLIIIILNIVLFIFSKFNDTKTLLLIPINLKWFLTIVTVLSKILSFIVGFCSYSIIYSGVSVFKKNNISNKNLKKSADIGITKNIFNILKNFKNKNKLNGNIWYTSLLIILITYSFGFIDIIIHSASNNYNIEYISEYNMIQSTGPNVCLDTKKDPIGKIGGKYCGFSGENSRVNLDKPIKIYKLLTNNYTDHTYIYNNDEKYYGFGLNQTLIMKNKISFKNAPGIAVQTKCINLENKCDYENIPAVDFQYNCSKNGEIFSKASDRPIKNNGLNISYKEYANNTLITVLDYKNYLVTDKLGDGVLVGSRSTNIILGCFINITEGFISGNINTSNFIIYNETNIRKEIPELMINAFSYLDNNYINSQLISNYDPTMDSKIAQNIIEKGLSKITLSTILSIYDLQDGYTYISEIMSKDGTSIKIYGVIIFLLIFIMIIIICLISLFINILNKKRKYESKITDSNYLTDVISAINYWNNEDNKSLILEKI